MRQMKWMALFAVVILLIGVHCPVQAEVLTYSLGDTIQDFTFTNYDGQQIQFSDILKEKEAVLINIWATWCGYCIDEFPYLQQAYEEYQDKVEVIALSSEPRDTVDVLEAFAKKNDLTFKMGQDPVDLLSALHTGSIPTTLMVDRFGTICLIVNGAQPGVESFRRMFDAFLGEDYTESVLYRGIPAAKPDVTAATEEELSDALEVKAENPTQARVWPMLPEQCDGRNVLVSSNAGQESSTASVSAELSAKAGEAILVTFKTSTESVFDLLKISVNGSNVKVFSGEHDWMDYAIPVPHDGEYMVTVSYEKDHTGSAGQDRVWIDRIAVAENAESVLAQNPSYPPLADHLELKVKEKIAREIVLEDATGVLQATFGDVRYYIANSNHVTLQALLNEGCDPEESFLYTSHGSLYPLTECIAENFYELPIELDSVDTTGYALTSVMLYPENTGDVFKGVVLFKDEENVNLLCEYNELGDWAYVDQLMKPLTMPVADDQVEYTVNCIDEEGRGVAGVIVQICDESTCQVLATDENGRCVFTAKPYAWEIHLLMLPDGYTAADDAVGIAPVNGGELSFVLKKE